MARLVRCIEGHVFDPDVSKACPTCGALFESTGDEGGEAKPPDTVASAGAAQAPASVVAPPAPAARQAIPSVALIGAGATAVIVGAIVYLVWTSHGDRDAPVQHAATPAQRPASASPPAQLPPPAQPSPIAPVRRADAPPAQQTQQPPPQQQPAGSVWSSFSALQPGQLPSSPPSQPKSAPSAGAGQSALSPADRQAVSAKFSEMIRRLDALRAIEPGKDQALMWQSAQMSTSGADRTLRFVLNREVLDASQKGGWSREAIAEAMFFDARTRRLKNEDGVIRTYESAVALGSSDAAYELGAMYLAGQFGLPQNEKTAAAFMQVAFDQGHGDAALQLAQMSQRGVAVQRDPAKIRALYLYAMAVAGPQARTLADGARQRKPAELQTLANAGIRPDDVPATSSELHNTRRERGLVPTALLLMDRAARGDSAAIASVSSMMTNREVFEADLGLLARLDMEAARRGHANAASAYGFLLRDGGSGVGKPGEAPLWLFRAWTGNSATPDLAKAFAQAMTRLPPDVRSAMMPYFIATGRRVGLAGLGADAATAPQPAR